MGFGRGKGFTTKVRTEMTSYLVKGGGGAARPILTELTPTYGLIHGGGIGRLTHTELNPTYSIELLTYYSIGSPAINRNKKFTSYTLIVKDNPATAAFTITKVKLYVETAMEDVEVATFYETNGNTFSTRNTVALGDVGVGYSEHEVSLEAEAGDYIGIYYAAGGYIEATDVGFAGVWYKAGDNIPCSEVVFTPYANYTISLFGEGFA